MIRQIERIKIDKHTKEFLVAVLKSNLDKKYKKQVIDLWISPRWLVDKNSLIEIDKV